ncbi:efflux transporter periplasmic adaptor subunit [Enterobacter sp. 10-1]|uniref:efflux RND transporter periplasmic adaptor subunit n=1 Tax=Raoultella sp. 10-1 TaxID=2683201 RepID=UPI000BA34D7A|nr:MULTISPECIES: efflux RND transporter periplasmic adaptor subunit [Enterobacteriaceae]MVT05122.1 efflux RND transporter periplasmic adaptor subunit [Raoultella sp. 10-1]PAC09119.1 efflux transporter periplasmic adaptor subunit [Enterobacter sp. 10-1]
MSNEFILSLRQCLHHLSGAARNIPLLSFIPLVIMVFAISLLTGCGEKTVNTPKPARPVRYLVIASPTSFADLQRTGEIHAHDETALSFRLDGRILSRRVDIGDRVKAGQRLATLDDVSVKNRLAAAQADVESAKASAQAAGLNLSRMQKLMPTGAIARAQLDSVRADWLVANARLKSSVAARRDAEENLSWARLVAPADGVITGVSASAGEVVNAGQTVLTLAAGDARDAVFATTEPAQLLAQKGAAFRVYLLDDPAVSTTGILRDISPQADPLTRTWRVRVSLPQPPAAMALGASVTVALPVPRASGYVIPASALSRSGDRPAVFVIDSRMQAQLRQVVPAGYTASSIIISSGLHPGDRVITAGVSKLRSGENVIAGERQP